MADVTFTGITENDGSGDSLRTAFQQINARFQQLLGTLSQITWAPGLAIEATPARQWTVVGGLAYVATVNHTAAALFATDLAAGRWLAADAVQVLNDITETLEASTGTTTVGDDDGRDGLVYTRTNGALADTNARGSSLRQFWARIVANAVDVRLLVIGDSTGNEATEWVCLLSQWLGTQAPTHSVKYRLFDTSTGWPAATTLSTGSGANSIEIWNGSVAGSTAEDFEGGKAAAFWGGRSFDAVVINMGHNYGTTSTEASMFMEFVGTACEVRLRAPNADLLVTLQNPRTDAGGPLQTANAVAAWRSVASKLGCGVTDAYTLFRSHPSPASLMADTVHPNATGQALWLKAAQTEFRKPPTLAGAQQPAASPLSTLGRNWLANPRFSRWSGAVPDGWTFTNCTAVKDSTHVDGSLYSLKTVAGGSGGPIFTGSVAGAMLDRLRGKRITTVARVYKPAGLDALASRVSVTSNNGVASVSFTSRARINKSINGWTWEITQIQVQTDATSLSVTCYAGGAAGVDAGKSVYWDGVWIFEGDLPLAGSADDEVDKFLSTWYSADAVALHPTQGSGTLTVTGGTIEVSGATGPNSGAVFNLPSLVTGATYRVTFDPATITGAASGFLYVRNGSNGGSSNIATISWAAADGVKTLDFTGVASPVSVWLGAGSTGTGWKVDAMDVTQLP